MTSRQLVFVIGCLVAAGCSVSQIIATPTAKPSGGGSDKVATPAPSVSAGASGSPTPAPSLSIPPIIGTPSPLATPLPVPTQTPTPIPTTYYGPGFSLPG